MRMRGVKMKLLLVMVMISACSSTDSQPVLALDIAVDWQIDCIIDNCKCQWKNSLRVGECRQVDRIPGTGTLSSELQSLIVSESEIVEIDPYAFQHLEHLQKIDLRKNSIKYIRENAFDGLKILTLLDLSENKLENIDPTVFEPLGNLKELRMKGNTLQRFTTPQMPALANLEIVDFSSCRLTTLPSEFFSNVKKLSRLDLSGNLFQQLSVDVFRPLNVLNSLNLAQNPFVCDCHVRDLHTFVIHRKVATGTTCGANSTFATRGKQFYDLTSKDFFCLPEITFYRTHGPHLESSEDGHQRSVEIGYDLTFDCLVIGDPLPDVSWLKDDELLFDTSTDFKDEKYILYAVETSKYKLTNFTIKNLVKEDSGIYSCSASNMGSTVKRETELKVDKEVLIGGRKSKTWIWILLGILGFLVFVACIVLIVLCFVRQRRRARKAQRVADSSSTDRNRTENKLYENRLNRKISATSPLLEKSSNQIISDSNHKEKEEHTNKRDVVDGGDQPLSLFTPMTPTPIMGHYPHPSVPSTPTFVPTHQFIPHLGQGQGQLYPSGWATYDPRRRPQHDAVSLNFRQPVQYGRLYSPFSGSVSSFTSEPPRQAQYFEGRKILPGYVTLPRRHRNPSWSGTGQGGPSTPGPVPPSPTGSLPLVPNLRSRTHVHIGPRYDNVGPRITADGGSNLSLNRVGLVGPGGASGSRTLQRTPGYITPLTPSTAKSPLSRSLTGPPTTPLTGRIPKINALNNYNHLPNNSFNFDPIEENDGPVTPTKLEATFNFPTVPTTNFDPVAGPQTDNLQAIPEKESMVLMKQPPIPPAKPKRKSVNLDEDTNNEMTMTTPVATVFTTDVQGTEV